MRLSATGLVLTAVYRPTYSAEGVVANPRIRAVRDDRLAKLIAVIRKYNWSYEWAGKWNNLATEHDQLCKPCSARFTLSLI